MSVLDWASSISTSLLLQVQRQETLAWQRMVDIFAPLVYRWCRRWGVSVDDAPDVVQEVFRRVARSVDRFQRENEGSTFRGWLWRISRNVAHDDATWRRHQPRAIGGSDALLGLQQIPDTLPEDAPDLADEPARILHMAMRNVQQDVQPQSWEIFWRTVVLGHDTEQIACEFQMTTKAVRQAKHRILKRMRDEYGIMSEIVGERSHRAISPASRPS